MIWKLPCIFRNVAWRGLRALTGVIMVTPPREVIEALRLDQVVFGVDRDRYRVSVRVAHGCLVAAEAPGPVATELARVVAGLAAPVSGHIHVDGQDVTDAPPGRRRIGYLPAGGALLPHLTIWDNIGYGLRWRHDVVATTETRRNRLVARLELESVTGERPHRVSQAQRVRAALARVVAVQPAVLVLVLPAPVGGGGGLRDLIERVTLPPEETSRPVLICSDHPGVLADVGETVPVERLAGTR